MTNPMPAPKVQAIKSPEPLALKPPQAPKAPSQATPDKAPAPPKPPEAEAPPGLKSPSSGSKTGSLILVSRILNRRGNPNIVPRIDVDDPGPNAVPMLEPGEG
jgi:type IV secretory pathway VirB10-like protein